MATKKTTTAPAKTAAAKPTKAAKVTKTQSATKTAAAPRHPLARLKAAHGTKADLVAKIAGPLTAANADADAVKARLTKASNHQLLHLAAVVDTVTKKFGSRTKLIEAIGAASKQGKDKDFLTKLGNLSLPQLLDLGTSAQRRTKNA